MKKTQLISLVALIILTLLISACGINYVRIKVDENGVASWNAIPDAVGYECFFAYDDDGIPVSVYSYTTEDTQIQLYEGYWLSVRAVFADGSYGNWFKSEIYGDPASREALSFDDFEEPAPATDGIFSTQWETLTSFDLIESIIYETVITDEDGGVSFEAVAPNGKTLRFVGRDLTVTEGKITFLPTSKLVCLDAIGRICGYSCVFSNMVVGGIDLDAAYTFSSEKLHVDSSDELAIIGISGLHHELDWDVEEYFDNLLLYFQPNFIALSGYAYSEGPIELSKLSVYYDETTYCTALRDLSFELDFYGAYLEGDTYDPLRETFDLDSLTLDFYLIATPELPDVIDSEAYEKALALNIGLLYGIEDSVITVGKIKDAEGNVVDKATRRLQDGDTLEITVGDYSFDVELPVTPVYKDAQNMNDLVPYAYPEAVGTLNTLVIPIVWQDEPEDASDEMLALYRGELGRVIDENGNVTDYSDTITDSTRFSLSKYYDIASYGKLTLQSFITDWYYAPFNFADVKDSAPDPDFTNAVLEWLYATYPNIDWTEFDKDANGYFDAVVLLNAGNLGDYYVQASFGGGVMFTNSYTAEMAGSPEHPTVNGYFTVHSDLLASNVIIHEFGHILGLVDYYDTYYTGIDAVGRYDMQSVNAGDWNAYSKYAAGWIEPEVVQGLADGESIEITIGAMATTGDAIVIPGVSSDHFGTPFSEYIMIDLFTDKGVNEYDAEAYGLDGAVGIRIYHVNSLMEYRELTVEGDDEVYPIGTIHTSNAYDNTGKGKYLIELIQASGDNTFTDTLNLRTTMEASDLFGAGDVFDVSEYTEFFYNGLMDDGTEFGYTVKIVSITGGEEPTATVRITRK